jgi:hypothetical protein
MDAILSGQEPLRFVPVVVQFEERFVSGHRFSDAANGHNSGRL